MTQEQAGWTSYTEYRQRIEGKEQEERMQWERARWQMFLLMQMHPNIKKHQKPATPQSWIRFPWEKQMITPDEVRPVTERMQKKLTELLNDFIDRNNKTTS